jgi:CYTH domain-containing protein
MLIALAERFEEAGFIVLIAFEGATTLMLNRVHPKTIGVPLFQTSLFDFDIVKGEWIERVAERVARETGKRVVIIYDRTWLDAKAYTEPAQWAELVASYRPLERCPIDEWNVIHVVTAADGAEPFYTLENNQARFESPEEARMRDHALAEAYQHIEHRFVIGNGEGGFARKVHRAVEAGCRFVGIPEPLEIERWFEIESFDQSALASLQPVRVGIFQFYVGGDRYRQRTLADGTNTFTLTRKREIANDQAARAEVSAPLKPREFAEARQAHPSAPSVRKTRWVWDERDTKEGGHRMELDVFDDPFGVIKLEVETPTRDEEIAVPTWIKVRREVTGLAEFSNAKLALR